MKLQEYTVTKGVEALRRNFSNGEGNPLGALGQQFPSIQKKTLGSICTQEVQRKVKKSFHRFNAPEKSAEIFKSYLSRVEEGEAPGVLVRMSQEMDYSAAMLAKLVLEHHLRTSCPNVTISKSQINGLLRDTTLIDDRDLSYEIYLCLLEDDVYGPFADSVKHSIGQEYEFFLCRELDKLNIGYHDEVKLHSQGYDKTPDIKLDIPVGEDERAVDGQVINWIESKASFGDEESHRSYLKDQFWSYWNRWCCAASEMAILSHHNCRDSSTV